MTNPAWPAISDEALVERLIPAIQQAIVAVTAADQGAVAGEDFTAINAPDTANALLMILASLLAASPDCFTPRGVRLLADAAGKELAVLIREARKLRQMSVNCCRARSSVAGRRPCRSSGCTGPTRIGALALAGDEAGVERFRQIAGCIDQLRACTRQ